MDKNRTLVQTVKTGRGQTLSFLLGLNSEVAFNNVKKLFCAHRDIKIVPFMTRLFHEHA